MRSWTTKAGLIHALLLTVTAAQARTLTDRTRPTPLNVAEIAVTIDIGYWVAIECADQVPQEESLPAQMPTTPAAPPPGAAPEPQDTPIAAGAFSPASPVEALPVRQASTEDPLILLEQADLGVYSGCTRLQVRCNFALTLNCTIVPTGVIPGRYSCTLSPRNIDPPGLLPGPMLCVELRDADIARMHGGSANVQVATVKITVTPQ